MATKTTAKSIRVTCDTKLHIPLDHLNELQGDLKEMTKERYIKFKRLVLKRGIWFALHVWKETSRAKGKTVTKWWIVDGHGRKRMFHELRDVEKFHIPEIPCVEIEAASLKEAKEAVLAASSSFQRATGQGLYEFMEGAGFDSDLIDDYDIPDIDVPSFKTEFYDNEVPDSKQPGDGAEELDRGSFTKFSQQCPKCGFSFNKEKE